MTKLFLLVLVAIVVATGGYFAFKKSGNVGVGSSPEPSLSVRASETPIVSVSQSAEPLPDVVRVTMSTARGNVELELYPKVAPKTVANFVKLARSGFYDGTKFHRVIADFVVQGGDPLSKTDDPQVGTGGPGYAFEDEINPKSLGVPDDVIKQYEAQGYVYNYSLQSLPVVPGVIAMANAGPNTNGSQFFIVTTKPQPQLYGKHTVFGKVIKGMDVVLKIKQGDTLKQVLINN